MIFRFAVLVGALALIHVADSALAAPATTPLTPEAIRAPDASRADDTSDSKPITLEIATGLGWQVCEHRATPPPMESAFLCPGLAPSLDTISLELKPVKTANPDWSMWSGTYKNSEKYGRFEARVELQVSYAKVEGETYVFVDGRIGNTSAVSPVYFRITALKSAKNLNATHHYGHPIVYRERDGSRSEFTPVVTVAPPQ